jgi:uncharacterized protein (DUF433 family)
MDGISVQSSIVYICGVVSGEEKRGGNFVKPVFRLYKLRIMVTATTHLYIEQNDAILSGEPIIKSTRTPVRAIVELWRMGVAPEDIPTHLPHLTLAQVFDALSYFADHQAEITAYIEKNHVPDEMVDPRSKVS